MPHNIERLHAQLATMRDHLAAAEALARDIRLSEGRLPIAADEALAFIDDDMDRVQHKLRSAVREIAGEIAHVEAQFSMLAAAE